MNQPPISVLGMVWYAAEHYAEVKATMKDSHLLPPTHASWQRQAESTEDRLRREGHFVVRAHLVPDAFRQFCLQHGLDLDAKGRMEFANRVAAQAAGVGDARH